MWEVKKNSRFLSTGHGILPSCGSKARETMVVKCKLVLWRISPIDGIRLIGPRKPYLAEKMSLQSLGLAAIVAFFANETRFTQIYSFFRACSLENEVGDPLCFYISDITNSSSFNGKIFRKKSNVRNFSRERP